VCEGWLVFAKATCVAESHLTNHCCLSSRYLRLKNLAFQQNNFVVNADGVRWGWDGVMWVVCEGWLVFSKATCFPENHMTTHCCLSSRYLLFEKIGLR